MIKISIVTVCLNCVNTIDKTLESVFDQNYPNLEYIIIDGSSEDGTLEVIKQHIDQISYLISEKDNGIYDAMNKGIDMASGDIIAFINDGDWYESGAFNKVAQLYEITKADVIFGDLYDHDHGSVIPIVYTDSAPDSMIMGEPICHQSCFIKTSIMKKYRYDTNYHIAADHLFLVTMYLKGYVFKHLEEYIVNYSLGGFSSSDMEGLLEERYRIALNIKKMKPELSMDLFYDRYKSSYYNRIIEKKEEWKSDSMFCQAVSDIVRDINLPIAVFGNGKKGKIVQKIINIVNEKYVVIDNNDDTVQKPEELRDISRYCIIITPGSYYEEIQNQLLELGCKSDNLIYFQDFISKIGIKYYEHRLFS